MSKRTPRRLIAAGFTLVEMLLVLGLIVFLAAVLLPAVGRMRKTAYDTKTRALMSKISSACHAYYGDFHAYPGIFSENDIARGVNVVGANGPVTSSENMLLSLMGGLVNNGNSAVFDPASVGKGAISFNAANPKRFGSYLSGDPSELSSPGKITNSPSTPTPGGDSDIPEFIDAWPSEAGAIRPIIYMRARVGALGVINHSPDPLLAQAQYHVGDLTAYSGDISASFTGSTHWKDYFQMFANPNLQQLDAAGMPVPPEIPRGRDAFILMAQGMSRNWASKDVVFMGE
jgi:type II secretory pathway pseudopilin PulG